MRSVTVPLPEKELWVLQRGTLTIETAAAVDLVNELAHALYGKRGWEIQDGCGNAYDINELGSLPAPASSLGQGDAAAQGDREGNAGPTFQATWESRRLNDGFIRVNVEDESDA